MIFEDLQKNFDYKDSLALMDQAYLRALKVGTERVLAFEYSEVLTLGRRLKEQDFHSVKIPVVKVERGGEASLHNPGQLVIYPILNLRNRNLGPKDFVCMLEKTSQSCLQSLGIETKREAGNPGLFTTQGKILNIGLRIKNGVSTFGISINVSNNLVAFSQINSCGVQGQKMDKVCHHHEISSEALLRLWKAHFIKKIRTIESSC